MSSGIRSTVSSSTHRRAARARYNAALFEGLEERALMAATPVGAVDLAGFNAGTISGYATDADSPGTPITVRITIDGTSQNVTANGDRTDANTGFGFSLSPNLSVGTHKVTVAAIDPQTGTAKTLKSGTIVNAKATSKLTVTDTQISGFAFDKDAGTLPITVRVDVNGVAGTPVVADQVLAGQPGAFGVSPHGFTVAGDFSAGNVYDVYAIDVPSGTATLLATNNKVSKGKVETLTRSSVVGNVSDADLPDAAVHVQLLVDGVVVSEQDANIARADVKTFPNATNTHGFNFSYQLAPGAHTVAVVAVVAVEGGSTSSPNGTVLKSAKLTNPLPTGGINTATTTQIVGFATDADDKNAAKSVDIFVDGSLLTTVTADQTKPAGTKGSGAAGAHWFNASVNLSPGPHRIQLFTADAPSGVTVKVADKIVNNQLPKGKIQVANQSTISGYAYDPDALGTSVQVILEVDKTRYDAITADGTATDVNDVNATGHGFNSATPLHLFGRHTVRLIAIDPFDGSETVVASTTFTNTAPVGVFAKLTSTNGLPTLSGYAYDPDDKTQALQILVYADKTGTSTGTLLGTLTASGDRSDVPALVKIGSTAHGFSGIINTLSPGKHTIQVYAVDLGNGLGKLLGSQSVTVLA